MSNLLKTSYFNIDHTDRRVIDTNELIEKKLELMRAEEERRAQAAFVAGLGAEAIDGQWSEEGGAIYGEVDENGEPIGDMDALMADPEAGEAGGGFKAGIAHSAPRIDTSAILAEANEQAESILADAQAQAEAIIAQAMEDANAQKASIMEEAKAAGYRDGQARAMAEMESARAELEQQAAMLQNEYEQQVMSIEPDLVEAITDIYQYMFDVELSSQRQILVHLINNTIHRIDGARSFLVHVSPDDAPMVSMQKRSLEEAASVPGSVVEIIEDVTLSKNECMIETDGGIFDCGLGTELSELTSRLRVLSYNKN